MHTTSDGKSEIRPKLYKVGCWTCYIAEIELRIETLALLVITNFEK